MLKHDQKYITFDFETSSLNLRYVKPWQLAFVLAKGNYIYERHCYYIDVPNLRLSEKIKMLTHFNEREYNEKKRPAKDIYDICIEYFNDPEYLIVGQNILKYDIWVLKSLARMVGKDLDFSFTKRILDLRFLALAYKNGVEKPRDNNFLHWNYKIHDDRSLKGKVSLGVLLKEFGVEFDADLLHSALYDTEKTWEVFVKVKAAMKL